MVKGAPPRGAWLVLEHDLGVIPTPAAVPARRNTVNWRTSKARSGGYMLAVLALLTTSGGAARAESSASVFDVGLVGAWTVQVTLRDCTTNAPLGPPINSLVTFHEGGTLSESAGSPTPGQRSAGQGIWTRKGHHTFRQRIIALILFDTAPNLPGTPTFDPTLPVTPGFFAGWATVAHTAKLTDADHLTSAGTNAFYKFDGTVYRTGCSTALGQRFK